MRHLRVWGGARANAKPGCLERVEEAVARMMQWPRTALYIYLFGRIEGGGNLEAMWPRAEAGTDRRMITCCDLSNKNLRVGCQERKVLVRACRYNNKANLRELFF